MTTTTLPHVLGGKPRRVMDPTQLRQTALAALRVPKLPRGRHMALRMLSWCGTGGNAKIMKSTMNHHPYIAPDFVPGTKLYPLKYTKKRVEGLVNAVMEGKR